MSLRGLRIVLAVPLISVFAFSPLAYADDAAPTPAADPIAPTTDTAAPAPVPEASVVPPVSLTPDQPALPGDDGTPTDAPTSTSDGKNNLAPLTAQTPTNPGLNGQMVASKGTAILPETDESTGALNYQYPITVPPGRNGMQPDLSLVYNSQQTSQVPNMLGYGWSTSIPYIDRINRTGSDQLYTAGYFNSSLSGELVQTASGTYAPKIETGDFLRYVFNGGFWNVTDKQGTVYRFGSIAASRQDDPTGAKVYRWMLDRMTDPNGNYVTYEYYKDAGQIYPNRITYTGNGTDAGPFEVLFVRAPNPDVDTLYVPGFAVKTNYDISQIQTSISGQWVRRYDLRYGTGNNGRRLLLTSITESGRDAAGVVTTLPPVQLDYTTTATGWATPIQGGRASDAFNYKMIADVNGDALMDVVYADPSAKGTYQYLVNGNEGFSSVSTFVPPIIFDAGSDVYPTRDKGVRMEDLNGDFKADIYQYYTDSNGSTKNVYINNGTGWVASASWMPLVPLTETQYSGTTRQSQIFDANGDGLPDVFDTWVGVSYDSSGSASCGAAGDANFNTGSGWGPAAFFPPVSFSEGGIMVMDVNGDGLNDIVKTSSLACTYPEVRRVYLNTGTGWTYDASWYVPITLYAENGVRVTDVNGDGLPDLMKASPCGGSTATYLNNGAGWVLSPAWQIPIYAPSFNCGGKDSGTRIIDVNGDGMPDLSWFSDISFNNGQHPDLLKKITFPAGGSAAITYQTSHRYRDTGNRLLSPELPFIIDTVKQIDISDGAGTTKTDSYVYEGGKHYYRNALDRRFAGFGKVTQTDSTGNKTITYYHQGDASDASIGEVTDTYGKIGRPFRIDQLDANGSLQRRTWNTWTTIDQGQNRSYTYLAGTEQQDYDGNTGHKDRATTSVRDTTNGNLTQQTDLGEVIGSSTDATYADTGNDTYATAYSYAANGSGRFAPSDIIKTDQDGIRVSETRNHYDSLALGQLDKGNLTKQEQAKDATSYIATTKNYNSYGLVTHETDPRGNPIDYTYDANNLYPATVTNAANQVWRYTYDYQTSRPLTILTPNNFTSTYSYDGLGRTTFEQSPDPATSLPVPKTTYVYTDTSGAVSVKQTDWLDGTNGVDSYSYFDGLGRLYQSKKEKEDASWDTNDFVYDTRGRLWKQSLPYNPRTTINTGTPPTSDISLYRVYTYDALDRVTREATAVGNTNFAYDDWKKTVTDPRGNSKVYYNDAYDRLNRVDEVTNAGTYTTQYTYDGLSDLTQIIDALGNVRSFGYDLLGRRTGAQDLHAPADTTFGSYTYSYDDAGNMISKITPNSQTITYSYDGLNRVTSEDFTGQDGTDVIYAYDTCLNGKGQLCSVLSSSASVSQQFDPAGNLSRERKKIDTTTYQTDYIYDRQGNVLITTNPDSSQIKDTYNTGGRIETIQRKESTDGAFTPVVTNIDYGPHGKLTRQDFANCVQTLNTYDPAQMYRLKNIATGIVDCGTRVAAVSPMESVSDSLARAPAPVTDLATLKGQAMAQVGVLPRTKVGDYSVQIVSTEPIRGGVQVFARAWDKDGQIGFSKDGSVDMERFRIFNPPVLVPDGTKKTVFHPNLGPKGMNVQEDNYKEDPKQALLQILESDISAVAKNKPRNAIVAGKQGKTTDIFYPDANPEVTSVDGVAGCCSQPGTSWETMYRTTTTAGYYVSDSGATGDLQYVTQTGGWFRGFRTFFLFDTSTIPDDVLITSATLSLYGTIKADGDNDAPTFGITAAAPASNTSLTADDYGRVSNTRLASDIPYSSFSTSGYNNFPLNTAGLAAVSKTGVTKFSGRFGSDIDDIAPEYNRNGSAMYFEIKMADQVGTVNDPKLVVEHTGVVVVAPPQTTSYKNTSYTYDPNGNVSQIVEGAPNDTKRTVDYGYDQLDRLTSATATHVASASQPYTQSFTYDPLGNLTSSPQGPYIYSTTGYANPHAATSIGSATLTYDANGNLLSTSSGSLNTWDYNNRLLTSGSSSYAYDAFGQRIKVTTPSGTTYYPSKFFNTDGTTVTKHIYAGDQLIATVTGSNASASIHYISTDHLSGSSLITDASGTPEELTDYYPYGDIRLDQKTGTFSEQKKFTGSEYDPDTGLNYMQARYQSGTQGRFISQDRIVKDNPEVFLSDPQQLNYYSYARNNPMALSDPTGNFSVGGALKSITNSITSFFSGLFGSSNTAQMQTTSPTVNQSNTNKNGTTGSGNTGTLKTTTWDPVTDKKISQLDPRVQQPTTNFINNTESQLGTQLRVTSGYRSPQDQAKLYAQGRTEPGNIVTNAKPGESLHNFGQAVDVVIMEKGKPNWNQQITPEIANIGIEQGFSWGGAWSGFKDYPHFEMPFNQLIRDNRR